MMAQVWPDPNGLADGLPQWGGRMLRTERYGTERKSHQDPEENPSVPDLPNPVDNRIFDRSGDAR